MPLLLMQFFYLPADLKAFERRLTEYVSCLQPATGRWRSKSFQPDLLLIEYTSRLQFKQCCWISETSIVHQKNAYCNLHIFIIFFVVILIVVSVCTATGAWNWLIDPDTQKVRFKSFTDHFYKEMSDYHRRPHSACMPFLSFPLLPGFFLLIFMESSVFHH